MKHARIKKRKRLKFKVLAFFTFRLDRCCISRSVFLFRIKPLLIKSFHRTEIPCCSKMTNREYRTVQVSSEIWAHWYPPWVPFFFQFWQFSAATTCPSGWTLFNNNCYYVATGQFLFNQASLLCTQLSAKVVWFNQATPTVFRNELNFVNCD